MQSFSVHTFSNACEQFVFSMANEGPLSEAEAKLIEYYCRQILLTVTSRIPHRTNASLIATRHDEAP
jgi:hypothetical protein